MHAGSQSTSHVSLSVRLPSFLLLLGEVLVGWAVPFLWLVYMVVITTKLHKAIPMVGANACAALKHTLLMVGFYFIRSFLATGCPSDFAAGILKILACIWNLACTFKGCFYMVWKGHFLMALGIQWTKYCSWDVTICQSPWTLTFFGERTTLDAPDLFDKFFANSFLYFQSTSVGMWLRAGHKLWSVASSSSDACSTYKKRLFWFVGGCIFWAFACGGAEVFR